MEAYDLFDARPEMNADEDDFRETWPAPPPSVALDVSSRKASGVRRVARRSCTELASWIAGLRSDRTTRRVSLDDALAGAIETGARGVHVVRQITCKAFVDGSLDELTRFFAGIIEDVVATTGDVGPEANSILVRVDVEGARCVVIEIADLRRVVGAVFAGDETRPIEIVRASDAMLGITVSADRDPMLGTVVRIELPAHPNL